jgi:1,4-alpha-glucan branching enzyme
VTSGRDRGELALVLHTHMPYVEGFGTWPSGEEWLWEAMAGCYLPLLDVLEDAPVTLSLTPVLCDQLEAEGVAARFTRFVEEVRELTHAEDLAGLRAVGESALAEEIERSREDYRSAVRRLEGLGGDLLGALAPHAAWTSAATHAVLPLVATEAGLRLQIETGVTSHRRRFGAWDGGLWLPECGYAPWLDEPLEAAGVHSVCLDLTDLHGLGAPEHLWPVRTPGGPVAAPIDRQTVELVWAERTGYPASAAYRDYHHHTIHHHKPWANHGGPYDREAAAALAREHAADFVARTLARIDEAAPALPGPPLVVCALDTELLGHWWFEGVTWLGAVVEEAGRQGLALARIDDALARRDPLPAPAGGLPVSTWGTDRDLSTWSGPSVADLAWDARAAELAVVARAGEADVLAVRELLALQASDWAFMVSRGLAGPYPRDRARAHRAGVEAALAGLHSATAIRNLAPDATLAPLLEP